MKKNRMVRIASVLLVAVLLSTCAISGTFAKYTTTANGSDTARVAKWGVTATVTGDAFSTEYDLDTTIDDFTAKAVSATEKVIAPGTSGTFTGVSLTGTPEVAVNITKTATVTLTGWEVNDTYYCPLVVTVNGTQIKGTDHTSAEGFANAIKAAIETGNGNYGPGTNLATIANMNGDYSWTWAFEGNDDTKDTALGDLATAPSITLLVSVTVTQVN